MKYVIFDNDIGIDDAMALLFLHFAKNVELVAITAGFGNASLEDTSRNALYIKQRFSIDAPVFAGASVALGEALGEGYPDFVHGVNGLGDIPLEHIEAELEASSASQAIVDIVRARPNEISIVAVGRMTNLAHALSLDPEIAGIIKELVVMGGVFGENGHSGNLSPVAEANFGGDPSAADLVLGSGIPTSIVGLDVTEETRMDEAFIHNLRSTSGDAGEFIFDISRCYFDFHKKTRNEAICPVHDSSAVAYLLRPDLYDTKTAAVRVVTEGVALGQSIAGDPRAAYVSDAWYGRSECNYCVAVDAKAVLALYSETLANAAPTDREN